MAGLPGNGACEKVGPPLSCKGPRSGFVLIWSVGWSNTPSPEWLQRLKPSEVTVPPAISAIVLLLSRMVLPIVKDGLLPTLTMQPKNSSELPIKVLLKNVKAPLMFRMPPPSVEEFPLKVLLTTVIAPGLQ